MYVCASVHNKLDSYPTHEIKKAFKRDSKESEILKDSTYVFEN